jgi:hypothetical protein
MEKYDDYTICVKNLPPYWNEKFFMDYFSNHEIFTHRHCNIVEFKFCQKEQYGFLVLDDKETFNYILSMKSLVYNYIFSFKYVLIQKVSDNIILDLSKGEKNNALYMKVFHPFGKCFPQALALLEFVDFCFLLFIFEL